MICLQPATHVLCGGKTRGNDCLSDRHCTRGHRWPVAVSTWLCNGSLRSQPQSTKASQCMQLRSAKFLMAVMRIFNLDYKTVSRRAHR